MMGFVKVSESIRVFNRTLGTLGCGRRILMEKKLNVHKSAVVHN